MPTIYAESADVSFIRLVAKQLDPALGVTVKPAGRRTDPDALRLGVADLAFQRKNYSYTTAATLLITRGDKTRKKRVKTKFVSDSEPSKRERLQYLARAMAHNASPYIQATPSSTPRKAAKVRAAVRTMVLDASVCGRPFAKAFAAVLGANGYKVTIDEDGTAGKGRNWACIQPGLVILAAFKGAAMITATDGTFGEHRAATKTLRVSVEINASDAAAHEKLAKRLYKWVEHATGAL